MADQAAEFWFQQMARVPMLSKSDALRLAKIVQAGRSRSADGRDLFTPKARRAINKLVEANLRLVVHLWKHDLGRRFPASSSQLPDLLQEGARGLVRAAELFDPSRGYVFGTYAQAWIRKGFSDFMRKQNRTIHMPHVAIAAAETALDYLENCRVSNMAPSQHGLKVIAEQFKLNPDLMPMYLKQYQITSTASIDGLPGNAHEYLPSSAEQDLGQDEARQYFELVADKAKLNQKERRMLLAYEQGFSCPDIDRYWPDLAPSQNCLPQARRRFNAAGLATPGLLASLS